MNLKLLMKVGRRLARPDIFFYCGLYMMALLIAGTIAQKYIGLYQARHTFFSSFVFWLYGLPLPGGRAAMGLILISLLLKTVYSLPTLKTRQKLGSFIMHLGVIWLLTGAFITGVFSQEGYMVLKEGETSSVLLDYHKVELSILLKGAAFGAVSTSRVVDNQLEKANKISIKGAAFEAVSTSKVVDNQLEKANKNRAKVLKAFHEQILFPNKVLTGPFPFTIHIQQFMKNARKPVARKPVARKAGDKVRPKKLEKRNEENQAGLLFYIIAKTTSPSAVKKQSYALFEPVPETIKVQNQKYIARLQPARTYLPFALKLIDFKKQLYPGSDKAKAYQSLVHTLDRGITGRRLIKMNHPLRYKGYTFYQSSYIESDQGEISVLSVVKNAGQAFPYISSLLICLGLLIYICFMKKIF